MKERLGGAVLFNRWTGQFEPATVFRGLDETNFRHFEEHWLPEIKRRQAEFPSWEEAAAGNAQDAHWDWMGKAKDDALYDSFAVECDGVTQALMLIDLAPHFARIEAQRGLDISYIELIASAPWNRVRFSDRPKYKGAGRILIATGISLSVELELKGRIGLHSLPESEDWYRYLKFKDCGFDDDKKMQYFEMTEEDAKQFLQDEED